jgi:cob(I)alamin adenosyltransferase
MKKRISITTRRGDDGLTNWTGTTRIPKASPPIQTIGDLDELNSMLGFARALSSQAEVRSKLFTIQQDLFIVGELLMQQNRADATSLSLNRQIRCLEDEIDSMETTLPVLRKFILPGGQPDGAMLHVARSVCRRAERSVAALQTESGISNDALPYLNRLSDWLFLLARSANHTQGYSDPEWDDKTETKLD